ncbi:MAG: threonine synthase, partial [Oscillospiraceae bacterium]|nr:threonine synthase [Oscillospiraceae bacterium]
QETSAAIKRIYEQCGYIIDTHTAVAISVYNDYKKATGDETKTIIASTASPYKFTNDVLSSIGGKTDCDDFAQIDELSKMTDTAAPKQLLNLKNAEIRFKNAIDKDGMKNYVLQKFTSK